MGTLVLLLIGHGLDSGIVAAAIWKNKGGDTADGFALGLLLGILGVLIAAVMTPQAAKKRMAADMRECPYCRQQIRRDASVCPYCRREWPAWHLKDGYWWVNIENR